MNFKELISDVLEEEGRFIKDAFGYRFDIYTGEGYSEEPHIHFFSKQTGNKGALSLLRVGYFVHGDCKGVLEKEPYKYIVKKLRDDDIFKAICLEWNKTLSCKKFGKVVKNPYSGNNVVLET